MATTTDTLSAPIARRRIAARFLLAFLVGLGIVLAIAAGAVYAFEERYAGRILPGVRVGSVDLSDLDRAAAARRLEEAFAGIASGTLVLHGAADDATFGYGQLGRAPDVEAMLDDAFAAGRPTAFPERILAEARTVIRGVELPLRVAVDEAAVSHELDGFAAGFDRQAVSASVIANADGFDVRPGAPGRTVDTDAAIVEIVARLRRVDAPPQIKVVLRVATLEPRVSDAEAARSAASAQFMARDLVLADGPDSWTIPASEVKSWIRLTTTADGRYVPVANLSAVKTSLKALAPMVQRAPKDATFLLGKANDPVGVRPGVDGRALDVDASLEQIVVELGRRANGSIGTPSVALAMQVTKPAVPTEDAEKVAPLMSKISTWTTYYPISERNGFGANIEVPTLAIDGTVVPAGGTFDFWKVVGEVSRERGYRQGGAIINGRTEPQGALAGGICSCSTTLFNAAIRAGMQMGARRNHYYYIDRYPLGLDATVFISASGATQTMSWTNDTAYPILIRGSIRHSGTRGYVTFSLYSVPTGRTVSFTTPIVKNVRPATTITEETTTLRPGTRKQVEYPTAGKDVWVTRTVTDASGAVIHQETYYSHYARVDGVIQVGVAAPKPSPEPTPSPAASPAPDTSPAPDPGQSQDPNASPNP